MMIVNWRIYVLSVLIFTSSLSAQKISGVVSDVKSDTRISDVRVILKPNSSQFIDTVITNKSGYWEYELSTTNIENHDAISNNFKLEQNYPNPYNPSTIIAFNLNQPGNILIEVHDILGRLIDSKAYDIYSGNYQITYEGKGSAGIYFYTVSIGNKSITKKMLQLDGGSGRGLYGLKSAYKNTAGKQNKITATDIEIVFSKFAYKNDTLYASVNGNKSFTTKLETVHSYAILVDLHNDILERVYMNDPDYHLGDLHTKFETDIPRLQEGQVDLQFFAVWVSPSVYQGRYFDVTIDMIDLFNSEVALNPSSLVKTFDLNSSLATISSGKIAGVIGVEGGHSIENDLDKLVQLYNRGMRYMTITWNNSTEWAVSAQDNRSATVGLSGIGPEIIKTMDSLGIIIDVSHAGIKTIEDILEVSKNPIIATHSGARAVKNHFRNLYNHQIRAIAESGGVIGVVFYPSFLGDPNGDGKTNIADVILHIDYIKNYVGIDYVAIGSDFDGTGGYLPEGLEDVTKYPALTLELLKHGYSQEDVTKILGGNFMRVFKEVCK